ncbi:12-oxophytodienoic acid reductase 1 [Syncephalis plumigaleata]|nr:12-oxophytodienoic acid reductase 1 [Syncephalis plumigaleata]
MPNTAIKSLFESVRIGAWSLKHRVAMAPLTRCRADNNVPTPIMTEYYKQRATSGGLLITEATGISNSSISSFDIPEIWSSEQTEAWKKLVTSVKERNRKSLLYYNYDFMPDKLPPFAPSAVAITSTGIENKLDGGLPYEVPRALEKDQILKIIEDYRQACINAKAAGFDGVEVHAANGYLINQFLESGTNRRTDEYGGSIENRIRFCVQVVQAAIDVFGNDRVGIRFSPYGPLAISVTNLGVAYVHLVEPRISTTLGAMPSPHKDVGASFEKLVNEIRQGGSAVIRAGGYLGESADEAVKNSRADLIAFGRHFIANPDLPARIRNNWPLNPYNRKTFYTPGPEGYLDYPFYSEEKTAVESRA